MIRCQENHAANERLFLCIFFGGGELSEPATLEMVVALIQSSNQLHVSNNKAVNDKLDQQNIIINELKKTSVSQCDTCSKILVIKTVLRYQWMSITGLGVALITLAKLGYDFQGKILEFISGGAR